MKRKGFTLVELLVVIAIIALLMGILMPALARVRQLAFRLTCGTNLSGIGKAMLIYANDYDDELPKAGSRTNAWVDVLPGTWSAADRYTAYGYQTTSDQGKVTPSSSLYLLVKYAEVTPKQFVCKGETDTKEFKLTDYPLPSPNYQLVDAWDFGPTSTMDSPDKHCSYSYAWPFDAFALTTSADPSMAIAADRNPWLTPARVGSSPTPGMEWSDFMPDDDQYGGSKGGTSETAKVGNSDAHQGDGQNVLFVDSHVKFTDRAFCGLEDDNIYTIFDEQNLGIKQTLGVRPVYQSMSPSVRHREDTCLVQSEHALATTATRGR
jgi:prepilin-type N-terminal cleavage/methylation domain-containing protein